MENLQGGTLALEHRYEVHERTARHGFVSLYAGTKHPFGRPVWLKTYDGLEGVGAGPELFERLEGAAQAASALSAPGILRVLDYGEVTAEVPFAVSERIDGPSLAEVLEREGTLPVDETAALLVRVGMILERAHAHGLAHGGLAPRWIYLPDGVASQAHVDHFRLALSPREILAAEHAVMTTDVVAPFPPEAIETRGEVESESDASHESSPRAEDLQQDGGGEARPDDFDVAADVWALGLIAYRSLVGIHPFYDDEHDATEGLLKLRQESARPLEELGIEPRISEVVDRALSSNPDRRWPSAAQMARAFADAADYSSDDLAAGADEILAAPPPANPPVDDGFSSADPPQEDLEQAPGRTDDSKESPTREPGPADHLVTIAVVLLILSNLAWFFAITATS